VKKVLVISVLASALAVAACGQSASDKAKSQVCDARSDISKQVNELKNLTPATATVNGVKDSLTSIQNDLKKIKDAQGQLNSDRKQQVESATSEFTSQVKDVVSNVGTNLSLSNATTQLQQAAQQLASSYQQTFAKVDCS
jgi:uncharacterized membrane-anchored protein YjiN (DUF445 family)